MLNWDVTSWPFHKSGIDILGPFPLVLGQLKFLVVIIDYFTIWIDVEPLLIINIEKVSSFGKGLCVDMECLTTW